MDGDLQELGLLYDSEPQWAVAGTRGAPRRRYTRGVRAAAAASETDVDGPDHAWDAAGDWDGPEAAGSDGHAATAAAAGGGGGTSFEQRAASTSAPWALADAVQRQQKWDSSRDALHRSYVEHLPRARAMGIELLDAQRKHMEDCLAAVPAWCSMCGSATMELQEPAQVLYIGTEVRFELSVPVYRCKVDGCSGTFAPQPFAVHCFPANPNSSWDVTQASAAHPARWFCMRLLQLADAFTFSGAHTAVYSLATIVHRQHTLNGCTAPLGWEHFKRQLSEALMEYGYLDCAIRRLDNLGVDVSVVPLWSCCHGAPCVHLNTDFSYALCHYARCGTAELQLRPHNDQLYLHGLDVDALLAGCASSSAAAGGAAGGAAADEAPCSDFDAARVMGRTSEKCDVTAVGATMCRHAVVAHLLDISTGERYVYAAIMLYVLMVRFAISVAVVWYDINCRFGPWFMRWAADKPLLMAALAGARLCFPLPCFHRYSHSAACLERNDALCMQGVGRQYWEPVESLWSFLGGLGFSTQYMTHRNRWGRIERGAQLWNERQAERIVALMCSMLARTLKAQAAAACTQDEVLAQLECSHGISRDQALEKLAQRAATVHGSANVQLTPRAEYAQLRLQRAYVSPLAPTQAHLPPAVNVFRGTINTLDKLAPGSTALRNHDNRLHQLCSSLYGGTVPALDSAEFAAATADLAQQEIDSLQAFLMLSAQQVQLMEVLIPSLTDRRSDQDKMRRSKQALKQRMEPALAMLMRWLAGSYSGFALLPQQLRAHAESVATSEDWTVDAICRGIYPWETSVAASGASAATPAPGSATAEQLITRLRTHVNELNRATEELDLLAAERQRCLAYLERRQMDIQAALHRVCQRGGTLRSGNANVAQPCRSFAACAPTTDAQRMREAQYCDGLALLLRDHLQRATTQLAAARTSFDNGGDGSSSMDEYDEAGEEDRVL